MLTKLDIRKHADHKWSYSLYFGADFANYVSEYFRTRKAVITDIKKQISKWNWEVHPDVQSQIRRLA